MAPEEPEPGDWRSCARFAPPEGLPLEIIIAAGEAWSKVREAMATYSTAGRPIWLDPATGRRLDLAEFVLPADERQYQTLLRGEVRVTHWRVLARK